MSIKAPLVVAGGAVFVVGYALLYNGFSALGSSWFPPEGFVASLIPHSGSTASVSVPVVATAGGHPGGTKPPKGKAKKGKG